MKKSERLQKIMIFLADKTYFNLADLMTTFNTSRSTALRDIASLEDIGYPIYSTKGKHGGYGILHNKMTYHFEFTNDEIYALYFSMQTLASYQTTPFQIDIDKMTHAFLTMHSSQIKTTLKKMKNLVSFETTPHNHDSPFLKDILFLTIENHVLDITYRDAVKSLQVLNISSRFGQWYVTAFDHYRNKNIVLRCDRITDVSINAELEWIDKTERDRREGISRSPKELFTLKISHGGIDLYNKEMYPSMRLESLDTYAIITGTYSEKELPFILRYIYKFGETIQNIEPVSLKKDLIEYSLSMTRHLESI